MQPRPQRRRAYAMQLRRSNEIEPVVDHINDASPHFRRNTPRSTLRLTCSTGGNRRQDRHFENLEGFCRALDT
jgi:hypothetical protein